MERVTKRMLNHGQHRALQLLRSGECVFLTGEAGTGKSYVLQQFLHEVLYDESKTKKVIVCAPTGIAALNVGGVTLHRAFGIPIEPISPKKAPLRTSKVIREADVIVIDEISMCRFDCFEYVAKAIRLAEKEAQNEENVRARKEGRVPVIFPPKQLVVVGDFFQLPPVITPRDRRVLENYWGAMMSIGDGFAFQAPMWQDFHFVTVMLDEPIRQNRDPEFVSHLNQIRYGEKCAIEWLNQNTSPVKQAGVSLCPTNRDAEAINMMESAKLKGKARKYRAILDGAVNASDKPTADELELKEGMQVMVLVNDSQGLYSNGMLGIIKKLRKNAVDVQFNGKDATIIYHHWDICDYEIKFDDEGNSRIEPVIIGAFCQLPLRIAYAITIHKSQGQTYECANINPACFSSGQLYVALSRVKTVGNIHLFSAIQERYLIASQAVINFYEQGIKMYDPIHIENKELASMRILSAKDFFKKRYSITKDPDRDTYTLQVPKSAVTAVLGLLESREWD